ncbi:hypothetical protein BC936DRAFT_148868 [Jimgerdemannia flammicorona]|uniref:Uncharacterized protein n=1 Tax=Jimgerdemannia flammicorona TaxID=994334 RepID=A0A433D259_9FUNG|nr:hypothetical protein BC936DRAFT_148868 [Jimgerdemannia flammicorona]
MAKRRSKRASKRKEQSRRDKTNRLFDRTTSEPFREYCQFLESVRSHGMAAGEYTKIPLELIDLTATLIATLITGHSYSYFLFGPAITFPSSPTRSHSPTSNSFHATLHHDVAFIRRVLRRAQISCTELILSLFYIDRFFHATKERQGGLRRKSRLDGAESSSSSSGSEIEAESGTESASGEGEGKSGKADGWSTRDLFMASIVVADKFLCLTEPMQPGLTKNGPSRPPRTTPPAILPTSNGAS